MVVHATVVQRVEEEGADEVSEGEEGQVAEDRRLGEAGVDEETEGLDLRMLRMMIMVLDFTLETMLMARNWLRGLDLMSWMS